MNKLKKKILGYFSMILAVIFVVQVTFASFATQTNLQDQQPSHLNENGVCVEQEMKMATDSNVSMREDAAYSLIPLQKVEAYLMLLDYEESELKEMPIETVLSLLKDSDGKPVATPSNAEVVWSYFKDEDGNVIEDEYHVLREDATIDLSPEYYDDPWYEMELIVGSGKQLDPNNSRYIVQVYASKDIVEDIDITMYTSDGDKVQRVRNAGISIEEYQWLEDKKIPITAVSYMDDDFVEGQSYYISISSSVDSSFLSERIKLDVYPMEEFLEYHVNGLELDGAITEKVMNATAEMIKDEGGWQSMYEFSEDPYADNSFCFVYTDTVTGEIVGYHGLMASVCKTINPLTGKMYSYENGQMIEIGSMESNYPFYSPQFDWHFDNECENGIRTSMYSYDKYIELAAGYDRDQEYYFVFDENENIEMVTWSYHNFDKSREDIELAEDADHIITEQVMGLDKEQIPFGHKAFYGYVMNGTAYYSHGVQFTLFFTNGTSARLRVRAHESENSAEAVEIDDAPINDGEDPYFNVYGAVGVDPEDVYIVENSYDRILDTLYGYGYQTMFVLDPDVNLSTLKPYFRKDSLYKVHSGTEQISGESVQNFLQGPVYYTVHGSNTHRNYNVNVVKQISGPQLFVNGPSERSIFLDEYFENRHDILIANIGDEELTGLNVELTNAVHVKLDDYWSVGGEKNDTLAAFDSVYPTYESEDGVEYDDYAELANLAKIRLVPDGEGEVFGTLTISADGQEDVVITLTGYAGNPKIITEELSEAVKYVPYSYMISTNNMHSWNKVTFSLEEGELPDGLEIYPATGEIHGVPRESGEFPIKVKVSYSRDEFSPSYASLVLKVNENTNKNVYQSSDVGYYIEHPIGIETVAGSYDFYIDDYSEQLFVSSGEFDEFIDFWMNGEKLEAGTDYDKESGSTRITIRSQTFKNKAKIGTNTIAAEFRVDGDETKELKRSAQNFRMIIVDDEKEDQNSSESSGSSSGKGASSSSGGGSATAPQEGWIQDAIGWWYRNADGTWPAATWMYLPYNDAMEWYYFNEQGYMMTGWILDGGRWYYLHEISDGMKGRMDTGWNLIDGKWYYMNEISDGTKGAMMASTWIGEYYVDENGVWQENIHK